MAEADIPRTFACNQCGTVERQRQGRGRGFTRCISCRAVAPTGSNALRIANAACNQSHCCEGCGVTFKPKRAGRTRFCTRDCAFKAVSCGAARRKAQAPVPVERHCVDCGVVVQRRGRCSPCATTRTKENARLSAKAKAAAAFVPERKVCTECFAAFATTYGLKLRRYCSVSCGKKAGKRTARAKGKARKRAATVEAVNPTRVFVRDGWLCHLCGGKTDKTRRGTYHPKAPELDHIVPLAKGGAHSYANTACAHRQCNAAKSDTIMGQPSLLAA